MSARKTHVPSFFQTKALSTINHASKPNSKLYGEKSFREMQKNNENTMQKKNQQVMQISC